MVLPQSVFALAVVFSKAEHMKCSHEEVVLRLPCMLTWIWLHRKSADLFKQHNVSFDSHVVQEEKLTRGGISMVLGGFSASVTLMAIIWLYNDLDGGGAGPWQRNTFNAAGLSCFGWGTVAVLLGDGEVVPPLIIRKWLVLMSAVITTTVHAQDFPDIKSDSARGRKTMPLLHGQAWSRRGLAVLVLFWSIVCLSFWGIETPLTWAALLIIGGTMAALTTIGLGGFYDSVVWRLWCVWLTVLYLLPLLRQT